MKKYTILLLCVFISFQANIFATGNKTADRDREIELTALKDWIQRTFSVAPDIEAYLNNNGCVTVVFNEPITQATITITSEKEGIIYSETIYENSPMNWPILFNFDGTDSYALEIIVNDWHIYGSF